MDGEEAANISYKEKKRRCDIITGIILGLAFLFVFDTVFYCTAILLFTKPIKRKERNN